ncbi:agrin-like [Corticium candelabrum]|uniref:agrin-like n=1 Tax=Corticium candelabrum TaxID=121492 RepID=UPI002E2698D0|nr:agrin-like [Corticium candelabrum]
MWNSVSCIIVLAVFVAARKVQGKVAAADGENIATPILIDDLCLGVRCASPPDFCKIVYPSDPKNGICCPLYDCRHPPNPCDGHECPYGKCVVKYGQPTCPCPLCTFKCQPVCGKTSSEQYRTFRNMCELKRAACVQNKHVQFVSYGPCPNHFSPCFMKDPCWNIACPDIACPHPILSKRSVANAKRTRADCCPSCDYHILT